MKANFAVGNRVGWDDLIARCEPRYVFNAEVYRDAVKVAANAATAILDDFRMAGQSKRECLGRAMAEALKVRDAYCRDHMTDWEWFIANG